MPEVVAASVADTAYVISNPRRALLPTLFTRAEAEGIAERKMAIEVMTFMMIICSRDVEDVVC